MRNDNTTLRLTCVAFGPRGMVLATGDQNGEIAVRTFSSRTDASPPIIRLAHVGPIQKLAFSPDGRILGALALRRQDEQRDGRIVLGKEP